MIQLIYVSTATKHFSLDELKTMLSAGRRRNLARGITGMIVFHEGKFLQILEGGEEVVDALYAKICNDERHEDIELLLRTKIDERSFADSSMGLCNTTMADAEKYPGLVEFLRVSHPFEREDERARSILMKFRDGAWH